MDTLPTDAEVEHLCLRNLLQARGERFFFKDLESRFIMVSDSWLAEVAQASSWGEVVGKTDFDIFTAAHAAAAFEDEQRIIHTGEPILGKIERETFTDRCDRWVATSKWPLRDQAGRIIGTFGVSRDVSAEMSDPVTGLANRVALMDRLRHSLLSLERQPGWVGLLFLDIDGFKPINDTHGHRVGDRVLVEMGKRLTSLSRRSDTVARYGGDEFVLLCGPSADEEQVNSICPRVEQAVSAAMRLGTLTLRVSASIGTVVSRDPAADPELLLDQCDRAMYAAKRHGNARLVPDGASVR